VARNKTAADRLKAFKVSAPIRWTADNAFTFQASPEDQGWIEKEWPRAHDRMVGLAVVDFNLFPVVMRPWGKKKDCYKWPYYFSQSVERRKASDHLAAGYAAIADRIAAKYDAPVALICMEEVDERLAHAIQGLMKLPDTARVFSARFHNASRMTILLRNLRLLVTSRYHASVLSLAACVPQIAVGHDLRLRTLYEDLGLLDCFVEARSPGMLQLLNKSIDQLMDAPQQVSAALAVGHAVHLALARQNQSFLAGALLPAENSEVSRKTA